MGLAASGDGLTLETGTLDRDPVQGVQQIHLCE
jgi:hypothetical protein